MEYTRVFAPDDQTEPPFREQAGGSKKAAYVGKKPFQSTEAASGDQGGFRRFRGRNAERGGREAMTLGSYKRPFVWARPRMERELTVNQSPLAKSGSIPTSPTMRP